MKKEGNSSAGEASSYRNNSKKPFITSEKQVTWQDLTKPTSISSTVRHSTHPVIIPLTNLLFHNTSNKFVIIYITPLTYFYYIIPLKNPKIIRENSNNKGSNNCGPSHLSSNGRRGGRVDWSLGIQKSQWQWVRFAIITEAVFRSFLITPRWFPRGTPVSSTKKKAAEVKIRKW